MNEGKFNPIEQKEKQEYGKDVFIKIKFMRHGERDKDGNLQDLGREITRQRAQDSGIESDNFDAVKAIGSDASPVSQESGMQRSLETAHIYANEIAGDETFNTRANSTLSYETLVTPAPYDHKGVYNSNLPDNYDELSPEEKAKAAKVANIATINHVFSLTGPEADKYRKEAAGASAYVIDRYVRMTKKLKSESKVLIPAGGHGGILEFILKEALVFKNDNGEEKVGFDSLDEIGGDMDPSEAFNIDIKTNKDGELQDLIVTFDGANRPQGEMHIDMDKIKELADFYKEMHQ